MRRTPIAAPKDPLEASAWLRWSLVALAAIVMLLLVVLPLAMVLAAAFAKGVGVWFAALAEPDARAALKLTLFTAAIVLPVNAGFGAALARGIGEYGSVIFIAGNMPMISEIAPLLIVIRLSEFRYADATAIAVVMLVVSFVIIFAVNRLQRWAQNRVPAR